MLVKYKRLYIVLLDTQDLVVLRGNYEDQVFHIAGYCINRGPTCIWCLVFGGKLSCRDRCRPAAANREAV